MKLSNTSVQVIVGTNVESVADDMKTRITNTIRGYPKRLMTSIFRGYPLLLII